MLILSKKQLQSGSNCLDWLDVKIYTLWFWLDGGHSSARLEPQIVDLAVAGSNPVGHPIFNLVRVVQWGLVVLNWLS